MKQEQKNIVARPPMEQALPEFVRRIERLQEEIDALMQDRKDLYTEAQLAGLQKKTLASVIARRKRERDEVDMLDSEIVMYERALEGVA